MSYPIDGPDTTPIPDECDTLCEHSTCKDMERTAEHVAQDWYGLVKATDYFKGNNFPNIYVLITMRMLTNLHYSVARQGRSAYNSNDS